MEMLQVGGHYIGITPANNTMGHGFYQFSPELFYNVFSADNGFALKKMLIYTLDAESKSSDWYEVMDPAKVNSRVVLVNSLPTYIMFVAQKLKEVPVFSSNPQQSDYRNLWAIRKALTENRAPARESRLKFMYRKFTPKPIKIFARNLYDMFTKEKIDAGNLGQINADHFKKFEFPKN
jgi:hypothetical protein